MYDVTEIAAANAAEMYRRCSPGRSEYAKYAMAAIQSMATVTDMTDARVMMSAV